VSNLNLNFGSYAKRPTVSPLYFFLIDVSKPVTKSGTLETFSKALKEAILNNYLYGGSRTKVLKKYHFIRINFLIEDRNFSL